MSLLLLLLFIIIYYYINFQFPRKEAKYSKKKQNKAKQISSDTLHIQQLRRTPYINIQHVQYLQDQDGERKKISDVTTMYCIFTTIKCLAHFSLTSFSYKKNPSCRTNFCRSTSYVEKTSYYVKQIKGTVQRDFLPPVFFIIRNCLCH